MRVTFGPYLDGIHWTSARASSGTVRLGPRGFLALLEMRLGLSGPPIPHAVRVAACLRHLQTLPDTDAWWSDAFAADPWATAEHVLTLRESLMRGGWDGRTGLGGSDRLRAVSVTAQWSCLPAGEEDRLRAVDFALEQGENLGMDALELQMPLDLLPSHWQRLIHRLASRGLQVRAPDAEADVAMTRQPGGAWMKITARDTWQAADLVAGWLASAPQDNDEVGMVCTTDSTLLDQALRRQGLPTLGIRQPTVPPPHLQVLPLVLANLWAPVDIESLLALVMLTDSPIPALARRPLMTALSDEAGIGGPAWRRAWKQIESLSVNAQTEHTEAMDQARQDVRRLHHQLIYDRHDPDQGAPMAVVASRCHWVGAWARSRMSEADTFSAIAEQADTLLQVVQGQTHLPRGLLERMVETVTSEVGCAASALPEASPWRVYRHPGQVVEPCRTLIWWCFTEPHLPKPVRWTAQEMKALGRQGIQPDTPNALLRRETHAWRQALNHCQDHGLLMQPIRMAGVETLPHPLWDEIRTAEPGYTRGAVQECQAGAVLHPDGASLAGREWTVVPIPLRPMPEGKAVHRVTPGACLPPGTLSYSSLRDLLACPLKWALSGQAGLAQPGWLLAQDPAKVMGTLCHRIIESLCGQPRVNQLSPEEAERQAGTLFDYWVGVIASVLTQPGQERSRARARASVQRAVLYLFHGLRERNLHIDGAECDLSATVEDIPLRGHLDLLLRDGEGRPYVLDLKWSGSDRYLREEIERGEALQLAVYARLVAGSEDRGTAGAGYFLLAQCELLSADDEVDAVWTRACLSLRDRLAAVASGDLEAAGWMERVARDNQGLPEEAWQNARRETSLEQGHLYIPPPCRFCDFATLCGLKQGDVQ